ncbi:membrane protein [Marinobacterium zhoushanense]|uniref:Membrane protein n=1 Tax=Marinobacterium zhoushanense TaxID=1679163 RepID=A0ABQ1KDN0_9GAMM|nr:DMT family transporter [Marinobacterium zhoushanense]GGB90968.1 membrane protein [Marinobacterium zhoushanense]
MSLGRLALLTVVAMIAFASNSLLCRVALRETDIDAASFTTVRLLSGALMLWMMLVIRGQQRNHSGSWPSALALFAYAALFSFAYIDLAAGTGALILFGSVQATMIGYGLYTGERFTGLKWLGLFLALAGLVGLVLPGLTAPPLAASLLMAAAGFAWGVYSLRGKGAGDPSLATAGNFIRSIPFALMLLALGWAAGMLNADLPGTLWAVASGALASALGYWIWYTALPHLSATNAATVQLSAPVIAAIAGVLLLDEVLSLRLLLASAAILGGIALVIQQRAR